MPQRNGQNPIRSAKNFGQRSSKVNDGVIGHGKASSNACICPDCKTEVPAKPGFRFSSLKCPKCGKSMGNK